MCRAGGHGPLREAPVRSAGADAWRRVRVHSVTKVYGCWQRGVVPAGIPADDAPRAQVDEAAAVYERTWARNRNFDDGFERLADRPPDRPRESRSRTPAPAPPFIAPRTSIR